MSKVSIFDIPLLLQTIGSYLNPTDYFTCMHLNWTWYKALKQHSWSHVHLVPSSTARYRFYPPSYQLSSHQKWKIFKQAQLIQFLEMVMTPEMLFLKDFPGTRLSWLRFQGRILWLPVSTTMRKKYDQMAEMILGRNLELRVLEIEYCLQLDLLTRMLPCLKSLNVLRLTGVGVARMPLVLSLVYEHGAESLKQVDLQFRTDTLEDAFIQRFAVKALDRRLALQRFAIEFFPEGVLELEALDVCLFLRQCPKLEDFTLPGAWERGVEEDVQLVVSTLVEYCPLIRRLDLKCRPDQKNHTMQLLAAYSRLQAFSFQISTLKIDPTLEMLLEHSAQTLEVLTITHGEKLDGRQVRQILSCFPRLKKLAIRVCPEFDTADEYREIDFTIQDLVHGPLAEDWEWACRNLESLKLPIFFVDRSFEDPPLPSEPIYYGMTVEMAQLTVKLLEHLISLPKLKNLDLIWFWPNLETWSRLPRNLDSNYQGPAHVSPSETIVGLMNGIRGDAIKKLDLDWINRENLIWVGVDQAWNEALCDRREDNGYETDTMGAQEFGQDYWKRDVDPEDWGVEVVGRNRCRRTGKSRHRGWTVPRD